MAPSMNFRFRSSALLSLCLVFVGLTGCSETPAVATLVDVDAGEGSLRPRADCADCHSELFASVRHPVHAGKFPTRCAVCHMESTWHRTERNHPWPLTGAHEEAACFDCHTGTPTKFEDTSGACFDCHQSDFDGADYPGHDRFAHTCQDCHTTDGWKPAQRPSKAEEPESDATEVVVEEVAPEPPVASPKVTKPKVTKPKVTKPKVTKPKPTPSKPATSTSTTTAPKPTTSAPTTTAPKPTAPTPTPTAPPVETAKKEHPETKFPISRGNHRGIECVECHSQPGADSKRNTDCVQCHKRSRYDGVHSRVSSYPSGSATRYFCVDCHGTGTKKRTN